MNNNEKTAEYVEISEIIDKDGNTVSTAAQRQKSSRIGTFLCIGLGFGIALGAAVGNIGIGMCIGESIGIAIGTALDVKNSK